MKQKLLITALCLGLVACGKSNVKSEPKAEMQTKADVVEVLYFHSKQRCASCIAIEKYTKELVDSAYTEELKNGKLVFKSVDITKDEQMADKYEVSWSSLILVDYGKNGEEKVENMTEFAFATARNTPEKFKNGIAEKINRMLNN